MSKLSLLVTGVGGRSVGHQILHALQHCGDKYRIVATDAEPFSFGLYAVGDRYLTPLASRPEYIPAILRIIEKEHIRALLPGTEAEIRTLASRQREIEATGCVLISNPLPVIELCSDKWRLFQWLVSNGFQTPRTARLGEWQQFVREVGLPVICKPATNSGGSRNVSLFAQEREIEEYLERGEGLPADLLFQEYVGSGEDEYTVGVLVAAGGEPIDSIVMHRKLIGLSLGLQRRVGEHNYVLSTGYSQGFIIRHPQIQSECERLARRLESRGPLNIQCRLAGRQVSIFEVHARFSGTTSIRADVGFNEPDEMIEHFVLGRKPARLSYRTNIAAIRALQHILVPMPDMESVPEMGG
jgi:carbamoyl-phosphate synthase large subunit